ncbi:MAG: hypothetical protein WBH47_07845 [Streptosporangiaceae bacterium]
MTQYGTWVSYGGTAEFVLAGVLAVAAVGVAYAGSRLPLPARLPTPGKTVRAIMLAIWPLAIAAFLVCVAAYAHQAYVDHLAKAPPTDPIDPVSVILVGVTGFAIAIGYSARGWRTALGSAVIGALAAWMIFEFPFDLIVMARIYPPIPPDPALYRTLFFAPLILIELTTLGLLTLSPVVRLSKATFWCFASMLGIFAVWSLLGFAYPGTPGPLALNVVSKILAFVTAATLFVPERGAQPAEAAQAEAQALPANSWTSVM